MTKSTSLRSDIFKVLVRRALVATASSLEILSFATSFSSSLSELHEYFETGIGIDRTSKLESFVNGRLVVVNKYNWYFGSLSCHQRYSKSLRIRVSTLRL